MLNGRQSLGVMAATDPKLRRVLERLGIDYVSCGDATLQDAAASEGLSVPSIEDELEREPSAAARPAAANGTSLSITLDTLRREHRVVISDLLWRIAMLLDRINDRELTGNPAWHPLRVRFEGLLAKVAAHVEKENEIVYPHITSMETAWIHAAEPPPQIEGGLRRIVATIYMQHEGINSDLKAIRADRHRLHCVAGHSDCRKLVEYFVALEQQLHEMMNLENFVIYPAAIALEDQLYGTAAATPV
jgi:iron-sulfur cluster repair protein YtfE (RIC family)